MVNIAVNSLEEVDAVCLVVDAHKARERWPKDGVGVSPALGHMAAILANVNGNRSALRSTRSTNFPRKRCSRSWPDFIHDSQRQRLSPCPRSKERAPTH